jgi:O-methyltransferase domain
MDGAGSSEGSEGKERMLGMLSSVLTVQALYVAAELGVADELAAGSRSVSELARSAGAHPAALYRLLRLLAAAGVFLEEADGRFALTPLGGCLRREGPDSVRDWALYLGSPQLWEVVGTLRETVRSGRPAFPRVHGRTLWDYMTEHPDFAAPFHRWMSRQSELHNAALVAAYDFSPFQVLADIGGGQGSTLAAILQAHPSLRGILFDLPDVVRHPTALDEAAVAQRCEVTGGDMLAGVPSGADAYMVKRTLMTLSDETAATLLRSCAAAMPDHGKVLAVEMVLPAGNEPSPAKTFDVLMLLQHPGACIRTEAEFAELFAAAGLRIAKIIPTASPNSILEGVLAHPRT